MTTGWALWDEKTWSECSPPVSTGQWPGKGDTWHERYTFIGEKLADRLDDRGCTAVYIEMPALFSGTVKGEVSASSGALVKLAFSTGVLCMVCSLYGVPCHFVEVNSWKGQLPKDVVRTRIVQRLGMPSVLKSIREHAWDAVGIGLYAKGCF
jgi:hypothetical protein